jgi:hypothetical protein
MFLRRLLAGGALIGFASMVSAASFSGSGLVNATPTGQRGLGGCGTTTLTQSTSQTITVGSVSCNANNLHADNSYFRAFSLGEFPNGFDVCALQFGVEEADAGDPATSQPVTVNIYANTGGVFPAGTRVLVGTASATVADQNLAMEEILVTGTVPAGAELVAEVFTPNGQAAGHAFFIGSNTEGQSGPSYLAAAACGITAPTTTSAIGFPNMHIVMNVLGTPVAALAPSVPVPATSRLGLALSVLLVVLAAFWTRRRA